MYTTWLELWVDILHLQFVAHITGYRMTEFWIMDWKGCGRQWRYYNLGKRQRCPWGWASKDIQTIGTWRWQGCQNYVSGAFTPKERPQGHSEAGKIMSMKNLTDSIRNRTRNLPAWSAVPQQTALPRTLYKYSIMNSTKSPASGAS